MAKTYGQITDRLKKIRELPSLPEIVGLIEEVLADENASAQDVANVVQDDPAATARILQVANSALYTGRFPHRCQEVAEAIARIGFREVRNLCLALSVVKLFPEAGASIDHKAFWCHSLFVANATRVLLDFGRTPSVVDPGAHFTSGLLHDIGTLVLDQFFHNDFVESRAVAKAQSIPVVAAEQKIIGADHGQIGEELARIWRLPANVACAIRCHEDPRFAPDIYRHLAQRVYVADFLSDSHDMGDPGVIREHEFDVRSWDSLGLSVGDIEIFLAEAEKEAERSSVFEELMACS